MARKANAFIIVAERQNWNQKQTNFGIGLGLKPTSKEWPKFLFAKLLAMGKRAAQRVPDDQEGGQDTGQTKGAQVLRPKQNLALHWVKR